MTNEFYVDKYIMLQIKIPNLWFQLLNSTVLTDTVPNLGHT